MEFKSIYKSLRLPGKIAFHNGKYKTTNKAEIALLKTVEGVSYAEDEEKAMKLASAKEAKAEAAKAKTEEAKKADEKTE